MIRHVLAALTMFWGIAYAAEPLTAADVERFIAVGNTLESLDETYPDIDIDIPNDNPQQLLETLINEEGDLNLFTVISQELAAHPDAGEDFQKVLRDKGFSSSQEFGKLGDRITTTMFALNFSETDLQDLRQIGDLPSNVLAQLPPEMQAMMKRARLFATSIDEVSASDKEVLRPYQDQIEGLGGDFGG